MPILAQMNWRVAIMGKVTSANQSVAKPRDAPATAYVPMPDRSSSGGASDQAWAKDLEEPRDAVRLLIHGRLKRASARDWPLVGDYGTAR